MKLNEIKAIIKDFEQSSLTILELEAENFKLRLSKNKEQTFGSNVVVQSGETIQTADSNQSQAPREMSNHPTTPVVEIKSPLVGTFYEAAKPNAKPFVKAGDKVKKGQVVCIVEAMKIMNEITSPYEGTIDKVLFKNGAVVGFDDILFTVVQ